MRLADVSQLPVLDDGKLVGVIDESDILLGVHADAPRFRDAVSSAMNAAPETLAPGASRLSSTHRPVFPSSSTG